MDDLMYEISSYARISNFSLKNILFSLYKQIDPKETFFEFSKWITSLINDFSDIRINLIDDKKLFEYLSSVERINQWTLEKDFSKEIMQKDLLFWEKAERLFLLFDAWSKENNQSYKGDVYRLASNNAEDFFASSNQKWFFCGLNILSKSEQKTIDQAKEFCETQFYFDTDKFFLEDSKQEAGKFQRILIDRYAKKDIKWVFDNFSDKKKIIQYKVANNQEQAELIGYLIEQIPEKDWDETLISLIDETSLESVLYALPQNRSDFNVTMGFPLVNHKWNDFFDALLQILDTHEKKYPFEKELVVKFTELCADLLSMKINTNSFSDLSLYANENEIKAMLEGFFWKGFLQDSTNKVAWFERFTEWISTLSEKQEERNKTFLGHYYQVFVELQSVVNQNNTFGTFEDIRILYQNLSAEKKVSFVGESMEGLQIMGLLETRLLSYKRVILASVNEICLPGKSDNSLIPFDVRNIFSLPSFLENEATYAYYFFRLVQWSDHISLISVSDKGEESRYIKQLKIESNHWVEEVNVRSVFELNKSKTLTIDKNNFVVEKLNAWLERGVSVSALSTFQRDPVEFYRQYVLGIRTVELPENNISAMELGVVVHDVLEVLYTPFVGVELKLEDLENIKKQVKTQLKDSFYKNELRPILSPDLLSYEAALQMVYKTLEIDKKLIEKHKTLEIISLEKSYKRELTLSSYTLNLVGKIDRIHRLGNSIIAVDYKTGKVEQTDLKWDNPDQLVSKGKITQLMIYHYMMSLDFPSEEISTEIYPLRDKQFHNPLSIEGNMIKSQFSEREVESHLGSISSILDRIFDEQEVFEKINIV